MDLRARVLHLEAWAREELAAQRNVHAGLVGQAEGLRRHDLRALEVASLRLAAEADRAPARAVRRDRIVAGLAEELEVPAGLVTLGSLIERLGPLAGELPDLRAELRAVTGEVAKAARAVRRVARVLRDVQREILGALLGNGAAQPWSEEGTLLNAEA